MSDDEFPTVVVDESVRDTETGVESTRTIIAEVQALWASKRDGRRAVFQWDDDRETYRLKEYERVKHSHNRWRDGSLTFRQKDVDTLRFVADYLKDTARDPIDVELFVGDA